ncbi:unnamed protein product [Fusarium graminearum]|nr:unnamed protein product [Fusarium graminearum]
MSNYTKVVDGVVVTDTDVPPPRDWTNMVKERGLYGNVKPLYGSCSYTGEALYLMEVGDQSFFFWNALDDSMYRVNGGMSLEKIVASLDEQGMNGLDLEEI